MKLNFPVYDADHHLYEPEEAFLRHLPKEYAGEFYYVEAKNRKKLVLNGVVSDYIPNPTFTKVAAPGTHEVFYRSENHEGLSLRELSGSGIVPPDEWSSVQGRLGMMDRMNLHGALLFPTLASVIESRLSNKPKAMGALFHSLNTWLDEEFGFATEGRLYGVPMVNLADLDQAVKTLEFVIKRGARLIADPPRAGAPRPPAALCPSVTKNSIPSGRAWPRPGFSSQCMPLTAAMMRSPAAGREPAASTSLLPATLCKACSTGLAGQFQMRLRR